MREAPPGTWIPEYAGADEWPRNMSARLGIQSRQHVCMAPDALVPFRAISEYRRHIPIRPCHAPTPHRSAASLAIGNVGEQRGNSEDPHL